MSDDVSQFLQQVQQLQGRRAEEDEARSRELEEKILQEKSDRAARRAGKCQWNIHPPCPGPFMEPLWRLSRVNGWAVPQQASFQRFVLKAKTKIFWAPLIILVSRRRGTIPAAIIGLTLKGSCRARQVHLTTKIVASEHASSSIPQRFYCL